MKTVKSNFIFGVSDDCMDIAWSDPPKKFCSILWHVRYMCNEDIRLLRALSGVDRDTRACHPRIWIAEAYRRKTGVTKDNIVLSMLHLGRSYLGHHITLS